MDADTKELIKQLNDKIQNDNTDIEKQIECIKIMISMIANYDLTNKPVRICPNCSRLKHISLFPLISNIHNITFCRMCNLNLGETKQVKFKHVKCDVCDKYLLVHEDVSRESILKQHYKSLIHQRHEMVRIIWYNSI